MTLELPIHLPVGISPRLLAGGRIGVIRLPGPFTPQDHCNPTGNRLT